MCSLALFGVCFMLLSTLQTGTRKVLFENLDTNVTPLRCIQIEMVSIGRLTMCWRTQETGQIEIYVFWSVVVGRGSVAFQFKAFSLGDFLYTQSYSWTLVALKRI